MCSKNVLNDAIYCDICCSWVHRSCSKLSKKQLALKSHPDYYYYCEHCVQCMPFMQISNEELNYLYYDDIMSNHVHQVYNKFKNNQFEMFSDSSHLDNCDEFYQNKTGQDCKYYLDEEITQAVNDIDGLSIIHFNARSLKANFDSIKNYITRFGTQFKVIAISETWLESCNECR